MRQSLAGQGPCRGRWLSFASALTGALLAYTGTVGAHVPMRAAQQAAAQPGQELVLLARAHTPRSAPRSDAPALAAVGARRPITGERTVLPLLGRAADVHGTTWLRVLLPGRPNSHAGWIRANATSSARTPWRIRVNTTARKLSAYKNGRLIRTFKAVVGKLSTPTPTGKFFVEESIALNSDEVGAPYALALSARSEALRKFAGGPGQIALHGLMNVGGIPGTATSHGCIRLDNATMRWLVARIGPGVPVAITR